MSETYAQMIYKRDYDALALENSQLKAENAEAKELLQKAEAYVDTIKLSAQILNFLARTQPALDEKEG